jgi:glycosyltransferase involved in cell wall biosynthesis
MSAVPSRYVLVSPVRDEAAYARRTLESIAAQTVQPALWVIVDDGSTDETPAILAEYAARLPYIRIVRREDRGRRSVGPGVIDAFFAGLSTVDLTNFDFVCKLDLDLDIPPTYFEVMIDRMRDNPRLGTCSGKPYFLADGRLVSEGCGDEMSVGMIKFYRTACFIEIGGFVREVMWDGIDCHTCRMKGWTAQSWDDPEIRFIHLRPMGSSHKGILTGRFRHGFGQYFMGTSFAYMAASAAWRMKQRPYVIGGLAMLVGWVVSALRGAKRYENAEFRAFLRQYQRTCLLKGKACATAEAEERQLSVWREKPSQMMAVERQIA